MCSELPYPDHIPRNDCHFPRCVLNNSICSHGCLYRIYKTLFVVKMANTCTSLPALYSRIIQSSKPERGLDKNSIWNTLVQTGGQCLLNFCTLDILLTLPLVLAPGPAISSLPGSQQWVRIPVEINLFHFWCQAHSGSLLVTMYLIYEKSSIKSSNK